MNILPTINRVESPTQAGITLHQELKLKPLVFSLVLIVAGTIAFGLNFLAVKYNLGQAPLLIGNTACYVILFRFGRLWVLPVVLLASAALVTEVYFWLPVVEVMTVAMLINVRHPGRVRAAFILWFVAAPLLFLWQWQWLQKSLEASMLFAAVVAACSLLGIQIADALDAVIWRERYPLAGFRQLLARHMSLFSVAPLLLLMTLAIPLYLAQQQQVLTRQHQQRLTLLGDTISRFVSDHIRVLRTLAQTGENDLADSAALQQRLDTTRKYYPGFRTLFVANVTGQLVNTAPNFIRQAGWLDKLQQNISDRQYFKEVVVTHQRYISRVVRGRGPGHKPIIVIAVPILDPQKRLIGVMGGSLRLKRLTRSFDTMGNSAAVVVIDQQARIIASSDSKHFPSLSPLGQQTSFTPALNLPTNSMQRKSNRLYSNHAIKITHWKLLGSQSLAQTVQRIDIFSFLLTSIALLLIFIGRNIATKLSRTFSHSIEMLGEHTRAVKPDQPIILHQADMRRVPREIRDLMTNINGMLHELDVARHQLQRSLAEKSELNHRLELHNRELDQLIGEKTRELVNARDTAEQLAQSRSSYLATMSHEIRTPLNGMLGLLQLFEGDNLNQEQTEQIETIQQCGQSLLAIVNDILDNAKIDSGQLRLEIKAVDPGAICRQLHALFESNAEQKNITFNVNVNSTPIAALYGDPFRLKQVLSNLISNAIKFTTAGSVTLSMTSGEEEAQHQWLHFSVQDSGIGIDPERLQSIFEPFKQASNTTSSQYGGTGLGLTIARKLAIAMGGHLSGESKPGKGSRFELALPLRLDPGDLGATQESESDTHAALDARILIAEDNAVNQKICASLLSHMGLEFELASNGQEAIDLLKSSEFDAILMDCQMPVLDGYAATRQIRSSPSAYQNIPIIAVTAHAGPGDREKCLACGMNAHVGKPYTLEGLRDVLREHLDQSRSKP